MGFHQLSNHSHLLFNILISHPSIFSVKLCARQDLIQFLILIQSFYKTRRPQFSKQAAVRRCFVVEESNVLVHCGDRWIWIKWENTGSINKDSGRGHSNNTTQCIILIRNRYSTDREGVCCNASQSTKNTSASHLIIWIHSFKLSLLNIVGKELRSVIFFIIFACAGLVENARICKERSITISIELLQSRESRMETEPITRLVASRCINR
mmetsp:Transcript_13400/g.18305  ORF Transcript_13400/g.18305 Transcript_13400/m.18305 type:complete len:210 (+) Transcript_13400:668-1297(+)